MERPEEKKDPYSKDCISSSRWEIAAIIAACIILISPFIYILRTNKRVPAAKPVVNQFAGSVSCKECHLSAYKDWQGSDHDMAMAEATKETVLGDFGNVRFTDPYSGRISRFFQANGSFYVETEGPDGKPGIFTITHTFGFYPLQQYLVPFPGGRLQCLSIAWDIDQQKWYRLPPYDVNSPDDWLHWTGGGQTWNGMCAECHSTRLQKNFDMQTESYATDWFEINVGCEACHGPGTRHIEWAKQPALGRPELSHSGLDIPPDTLSGKSQIIVCAPCHSRRYQLGDNQHTSQHLLDLMVPALLTEDLYFPDGQIKEEVYVYGSFVQSKMFMHDVSCNDCHNQHSLKPHKEKNELCLQCHRGSEYDTPQHHFHKKEYNGKPSEGYLCVKCHMPGRKYMGIDYRPDHSLRIPRPDLSKKLGTPNGCSTTDCHGDKSIDWTIKQYIEWYGKSSKPHYGEVFAAARAREPKAIIELTSLAQDALLPHIIRATALNLLSNYPGEQSTEVAAKAVLSNEPILRHTALRLLHQPDEKTLLQLVAPKLYDPVKAVRIEAALQLAGIQEEKLRKEDVHAMQATLQEYRQAMEYNADFAPQRYNLGNLERALGNTDKAITYYQAAIEIDDQFIPAKVNLAMEYDRIGKKIEAEKLLREALTTQPAMYEIAYSLGLLLSELGNLEDAVLYLGRAADGMPAYSRVRYNYGLALLKLERWEEGAQELRATVIQSPEVDEYFVTLVNLYLNFRMYDHARELSEEVLKRVPSHANARELLKLMNQKK